MDSESDSAGFVVLRPFANPSFALQPEKSARPANNCTARAVYKWTCAILLTGVFLFLILAIASLACLATGTACWTDNPTQPYTYAFNHPEQVNYENKERLLRFEAKLTAQQQVLREEKRALDLERKRLHAQAAHAEDSVSAEAVQPANQQVERQAATGRVWAESQGDTSATVEEGQLGPGPQMS
eukprot:TRINITY_DN18692_c0_g1_i1.p1 TRINITY_DN18692_c0_g1~~TRINITY_DN18692_c0_g1_i1.p1  ORF type:complete len:184 (+),score=34.28 TRINITY_DN18692_c0_g1_i1:218-769(+)